jgi:hypothetical protein
MVDLENERDKELDSLLSPLESVRPSDIQIAKWRAALKREANQTGRRRLPRVGEWLLAASAGFLLAIILGQLNGSDHDTTAYSGVDATQMRLVANQD